MVVLNNTGAGSQLTKKPSVSGSTPKRPAPPRPSPGSKTPEKQNSDYQKKTTRWEMFTQPIEVFDFFFFLSKITHFTWWCSVDVSSSTGILPVWVHVIERISVYTQPVSCHVHCYDKRLLSRWSWCQYMVLHVENVTCTIYYIYVCKYYWNIADKSKVSGSGSGLWDYIVRAMQYHVAWVRGYTWAVPI